MPPTDDPRWLRCDVRHLREPDLGTLDALALLALEARREGRRLLLTHASAALRALVAFAGLEDVLCLEAATDPPDEEPAGPAARRRGTGGPCRGRR